MITKILHVNAVNSKMQLSLIRLNIDYCPSKKSARSIIILLKLFKLERETKVIHFTLLEILNVIYIYIYMFQMYTRCVLYMSMFVVSISEFFWGGCMYIKDWYDLSLWIPIYSFDINVQYSYILKMLCNIDRLFHISHVKLLMIIDFFVCCKVDEA